MARAEQITEGEWVEITHKFKHQCCDCGLRHDLEFRRNKRGVLEMRGVVNAKATANARRPLKKKVLVIE